MLVGDGDRHDLILALRPGLDSVRRIAAAFSPSFSPLTRAVLVHGTRDTAASFDGVRSRLRDLQVTSYTRRGWETGVRADPAPLDAHVDDLLCVLDDTPSVVVGHSWGGLVAVGAAIRRPDLVRGIGVFEIPLLWLPTWPTVLRDAVTRTIERVQRKPAGSPDRERERALFVAEASLSFERQFDLADLRVPCVVGVGGASHPRFATAMQMVATSIGAELFEIPGATHMAHRDAPDAFATFVRRTLTLAAV